MTLAEIGRVGQRSDPLADDVAEDGRLLSVAEIQQRFRGELARPIRPASPRTSRGTAPTCLVKSTAGRTRTPQPSAVSGRSPAAVASDASGSETPRASGLCLPRGWVRVISAHGGAGASTVALAIADAAAAAGHAVRLVEASHPARSGLITAASVELGLDDTGAWERGMRGAGPATQVTVVRRATDTPPQGWPTDGPDPAAGPRRIVPGCRGAAREVVSIVDLGLAPIDALAGIGGEGQRVVVACRATIPGLRQAEQAVDRLNEAAELLLAVVGPRRWPGEVTATGQRGVRELRAAGRLVTVPYERRLAVTGPTHLPLPKSSLAAGIRLWRVLDAARPPGSGEPLDPAPVGASVLGATR